ncbi:MAG: DNA alkylation repair protein [Muribaculaceae bacterium]|nr:DNA alkylation repair protein [Muribaculaceae bacterium]MDE6753533.1 DNA alkylation repair protein [Muribaculaceae bacterium]
MLKDIKQKFFAYRNGIVADVLRRAGYPHSVIFGLQLPQISEIARGLGPSEELADALWADLDVRESRILACYLYPKESVTKEKVEEMLASARTQEEKDMIRFKLKV